MGKVAPAQRTPANDILGQAGLNRGAGYVVEADLGVSFQALEG